MAHIPKRNPEGTIIEIFVDPIQQLGFKVEALRHDNSDVAGVTHGVRLWMPRPKCGACGHEPDDALVEVQWITPVHMIYGEAEPWVGGFKYGLQRPAETAE